MGKKKKAVRDKYYTLAKEQGFRARSAFKLVQLNKKYGFLADARRVVDLCAAPGGWCQVAYKATRPGAQIVGVDLLPIQKIPGVVTFVAATAAGKAKKIMNKSFENLTSANRLSIKTGNAANVLSAADSILNSHSSNLTYNSTKNQKTKKTTLSSSPKIRSAGTASTNIHSRKPSSTRASKKTINKRSLNQGGLNNTSSGNAMLGIPHSNSDSKSHEGYNTRNSYKQTGLALLNTSNAATSAGGVNPVGTSLCDLNFFIKTIERDLSERFQHMKDLKNAGQTAQTPNSLLKKVESQMRSLGIDLANSKKIAASVASGALRNASPTDVQTLIKKLENDKKQKGMSSAAQKNKSLLPKLKLIALNQQIFNKADQTASQKNLTPSNVSVGGQYSQGQATSTVSPGKDGSTGAASSFTKTWRVDNTALSFRHNLQPKTIRTQRDRSEPNSKDRSGNGGSSDSRGRTGSSGPHSIQFPQPQQMVMTERSHRVTGKGFSTTRASNKIKVDTQTSQRQVKFDQTIKAKSKSTQKYKNKLLSPGDDKKKSVKQSLQQSGESLNQKKNSGSRLKKEKKQESSQGKGSGMRSSRVNHNMIAITKKQQQPIVQQQQISSPGQPVQKKFNLDSQAPVNQPSAQLSQKSPNSTLLDLLQHQQQQQNSEQNIASSKFAKQGSSKSAQRYQQPKSTRGDKPKQIEYYSPIQLTGRFMDSSQLVPQLPPNAYGTGDALDNSGSPHLGDQKNHQQHNSQGAPASGGSGSGSNPNRKQGGAFSGRDPRKPPMLQPTHYY